MSWDLLTNEPDSLENIVTATSCVWKIKGLLEGVPFFFPWRHQKLNKSRWLHTLTYMLWLIVSQNNQLEIFLYRSILCHVQWGDHGNCRRFTLESSVRHRRGSCKLRVWCIDNSRSVVWFTAPLQGDYHACVNLGHRKKACRSLGSTNTTYSIIDRLCMLDRFIYIYFLLWTSARKLPSQNIYRLGGELFGGWGGVPLGSDQTPGSGYQRIQIHDWKLSVRKPQVAAFTLCLVYI